MISWIANRWSAYRTNIRSDHLTHIAFQIFYYKGFFFTRVRLSTAFYRLITQDTQYARLYVSSSYKIIDYLLIIKKRYVVVAFGFFLRVNTVRKFGTFQMLSASPSLIDIYIYILLCAYKCACVHIYMCVCRTFTRMYTYVCTYIYTCIYYIYVLCKNINKRICPNAILLNLHIYMP